MIRVNLTPTNDYLANLVASLETISSRTMPNTFRAFKLCAAIVQYTWKSYATGEPIKGSAVRLKNPTGVYASSIKTRFLSPFNYEIYSDSAVALYIERGTKRYDMKKTHPKGNRSRVVKKTVKRKGVTIRKEGDPYLIIPFRHGVPGTKSYGPMSEQIFQTVQQVLTGDTAAMSSKMKGQIHTPNYKGEIIPRAKYKWGAKLGAGFEQLSGMVQMDVSSPKKARSSYMTFRVISGNSPAMKWIVKARPAMNITRHVVRNTSEVMKTVITSGIMQDIGLA